MANPDDANQPTQEQMDAIMVVQPAIVIGFNKAGELCMNVVPGNSPEQAAVMLFQMHERLMGMIKFRPHDSGRVMAAAPNALKVLEGMQKRNGLG